MKTKIKNRFVLIILILSVLIFQSCKLNIEELMEVADSLGIENIEIDTDEGIEFECIPPGYTIIYNGEFFVWMVIEEKYTHPVLFDTKADAIQNANMYYKNKQKYLKVFPTNWIQVKTCAPLGLLPQK